MKSRITLTIDPEISHRARLEARRKGTSVSAMVEELLADATAPSSGKQSPETVGQRWSGKFTLSSSTSPRHERLARKYLN